MPKKQPASTTFQPDTTGFALYPNLPPMEARQTSTLPDGEGWQFEPKWDGFRCLIFRAGARIEMRAKSGKSLARLFPEVEECLAGKTGRYLRLSPFTRDRAIAESWLNASGGAIDGVVAKRLDSPYGAGERAMIKVKHQRTADCAVGGFRYLERERLAGSLLLGLYNEDGKLDHAGFTSAISADNRVALTKQLERLIEPPGFSGKAPGGPSRWATQRSGEWEPLRPVLVVEVEYDHVTDRRFRHGTKLLRWRPDKAPRQCTFEQLRGGGMPPFHDWLADLSRSG
jgi:ATP-dependent DNA ligase